MTEKELLQLINDVANNKIQPNKAFHQLMMGPFRIAQLEEATIDFHLIFMLLKKAAEVCQAMYPLQKDFKGI